MRTPTYIIKNHDGIFYFRYIIPPQLKSFFPNNKREFRKSLKTRNRRIALQEARIMWVAVHSGHGNLDSLQASKITIDRNPTVKVADPSSPLELSEFKLSELVVKFINDKQLNVANQKTLDTYKRNCNLFINAIGDLKANEINARQIIKFKEVLLLLPKNINQDPKYSKLTLSEIVKLDIPPTNKLSAITLKNIIVNISSFLKWCNDNLYFSVDYSGIFKEISKKRKSNNEYRSVFSSSDITKLFNTDEYQSAGFLGYSFRYWLPILGLYTGARLNELCQLHVKDIYYQNGIYIISVNDNESDKSIKNQHSQRIIPVHSKLVELGFIEFVGYVKQQNKERLFPQLTQDSYGSYTRKMSRFFNDDYQGHKGFIDYAGIEKQSDAGKKDFHSFQHTFINAAKQLRLNERIVKEVCGYSSNDITFDTYGKNYSLESKKNEIDKITFDVRHPCKWEPRFY